MSNTPAIAPVTAVLFCFRQEDLVESAVRSIFGQTVQPAEIILSDDASPDGSYEVLCRLAAEYEGPAEISVRKTEGGAGWFAHINACIALARHDHVIVFSGDDISKPERIARFAEVIAAHPDARLVWSMMERMTPHGEPTGHVMGTRRYAPGKLRGGVGASQSWHKGLISEFGPLPEVQAAEDIILPFRAWLLGGLRHIDEPLVLWRDRDYRELSRDQLDWTYEIRATSFRINASKVVAADLEGYLARNPRRAGELEDVRKRLKRETVSVKAEHEVVSAATRFARLSTLLPRVGEIGFKRSRRLWQDQVLLLPAYLDSAYPRWVRLWLPRFAGLATGAFLLIPGWAALPWRAAAALVSLPVTMELVRMFLRLLAKIRWKPA